MKIYVLKELCDSYYAQYDNVKAFTSQEQANKVCAEALKARDKLRKDIREMKERLMDPGVIRAGLASHSNWPLMETERARLIKENPFISEYGFGMSEYSEDFEVQELELELE